MLAYIPLAEVDKQRMLDKFVSVTRATLKGTILIGLAQGVLGGLAFWVVGIEGAIFWGTVMTVLSIIPGVGGALVWVPGGHHPRGDRIVLAGAGSRAVLVARDRQRRQPAASDPRRPRYADARAADLLLHARRTARVRRDGFHPRPDPRGALSHGLGDVRRRRSSGELREAPPLVVTDREATGAGLGSDV